VWEGEKEGMLISRRGRTGSCHCEQGWIENEEVQNGRSLGRHSSLVTVVRPLILAWPRANLRVPTLSITSLV